MKKTLLATAIAGALGASAAAQAATIYNQDGTQLDLYGNIQLAYSSVDGADGSEDQLHDNGSTIGVAGQHIINSGLTGYFKAEWEHDVDEAKIGDGIDTGDQAYAGLKGNFGDARLGSWDPLIDDWIQDPITNNEFADVSDSSTDLGGLYPGSTEALSLDREGDKVQYMSPSFGGFQFAVGAQYKGDAEGEFEQDGLYDNQGSNAAFFGGVKYTIGGFSIAGVYDSLDNYELTETTTGEVSEAEAYGLTAQYTIDALRLAAKYERTDAEVLGDDAKVDRFGLGARYGYGFGDVYAAYQYVDADSAAAANMIVPDGGYTGSESFNEVLAGVSYNLSPAMYVWLEAGQYDREEDDGDFVAVGTVYSF